MIKQILLSLVCIIATAVAAAQGNLWSNPITYTNPNTLNPFNIGDVVANGITVSGIGRGPGINGRNGTDRYNASSWNTASLDLDAYYSFILTPGGNKKIDFSTGTVTVQRSTTGPLSFTARSSADGFTTDLFELTLPNTATTGALLELNMSAFQDIATPIEFRVYGYGASSVNGTASVNDFAFAGTVEDVALPVTFGAIEAVRSGNGIRVQWSTQQETNNDRFEIEASKDGSTFTTLKTIKSLNGNSSVVQHYDTNIEASDFAGLLSVPAILGLLGIAGSNYRRRFNVLAIVVLLAAAGFVACNKQSDIVDNANLEKVLIRIKQVDTNGQFKYSNVVHVISR